MAKITVNAKKILADIKAGMDNATPMEKYKLSEKGLQSLFNKLTDAGVLENSELDKQMTWFQPKKRKSCKPPGAFGTRGSPCYCLTRPTTDRR